MLVRWVFFPFSLLHLFFLICCLFLSLSCCCLTQFPLPLHPSAIWGQCLQFFQLQFSCRIGIFLWLGQLQISYMTSCLFVCWSTAFFIDPWPELLSIIPCLSWGCCSFTFFSFFGWAVLAPLSPWWCFVPGDEVAHQSVTPGPLVSLLLVLVMAFSYGATSPSTKQQREPSSLEDRWNECVFANRGGQSSSQKTWGFQRNLA